MFDPAIRRDGKIFAREIELVTDTGAPTPNSFFKDIQQVER